MVVISKTKLAEFGKEHGDAVEALNEWYEKTKQANWMNLHDIKNLTQLIMLATTVMCSILRGKNSGLWP